MQAELDESNAARRQLQQRCSDLESAQQQEHDARTAETQSSDHALQRKLAELTQQLEAAQSGRHSAETRVAQLEDELRAAAERLEAARDDAAKHSGELSNGLQAAHSQQTKLAISLETARAAELKWKERAQALQVQLDDAESARTQTSASLANASAQRDAEIE